MDLEQEIDRAWSETDAAMDELLGEARRRVARALKPARRPLAGAGVIDTALGRLFVAQGPRGIVAIHYLERDDWDATLRALRQKFDVVEDQRAAAGIGDEIRRFLGGDPDALRHEIDLSMVESAFQRRALSRLRQVPRGSVVTYQGLAAAIGAPDGQRAVGNTMASNPIPIYVPCHRVIRSDGSIGNYGGGVERKLRLLRAEGFAVGKDLRLPAAAVFGHQRTHIFCRPDCSAALRANRARMVIFANPENARRAGLRACKVCRPA